MYLTRFCKCLKLANIFKGCVPHQETATDNTPNPYTNFSRRHQHTVLNHRNDALPPQNNVTMASSEEQAVEALNNVSKIVNDHPVNCNSQSERQNQTSERGMRDNYRSMNLHQELASGFGSSDQASTLTCDILNFTDNSPMKIPKIHTNDHDNKMEVQSELMHQVVTTSSLNVPNLKNHAGKKKESSV